MKIFNLLSKIATFFKIWPQRYQSFLIMKIQLFLKTGLFERLNNNALFSPFVKIRIYKFLKDHLGKWFFMNLMENNIIFVPLKWKIKRYQK